MQLSELANRYVQALLSLDLKGQSLKGLSQELSAFTRLYQGSRELRSVLVNPGFSDEERHEVLGIILKRLGVSGLCENFIRLLSDKRRTRILPEIAFRMEQLTEVGFGVVRAEVTTARPMKGGQIEQLTRTLGQCRGAEVKVTATVQPEIIGGAVVRMDGRIYDGSIARRLALMREMFLKEG